MKAIMYHYVRPHSNIMPKLKHLHIEDFKKQLDFFQESGFVSKEEFFDLIKNKGFIPKNKYLLTFDDALSCHYDFVYPELKKRGLWGIFYVPTQPYTNHKMLDVHRIQVLLATQDSEQVLGFLMKLVSQRMLVDEKNVAFQKDTYALQRNKQSDVLIKRMLNYYISYEYRTHVIDELIKHFKLSDLCCEKKFYITKNQMQEMASNGMLIGSHTVTHPVLSKLSKEQQLLEIKNSFNCLKEFTTEIKTFCFPYGGKHSYTSKTLTILEDEKCDFSFDVNSRCIEQSDFIENIQCLPRFDCNEFPYGQCRK